MKLDIYLNYRGNCEQAFRFYEQHLGGRITGMVRHGYLTLTLDSESEAERLYALLVDGGEIFMKIEKTPFANCFAMLRDKFWHVLDASPST